MRGPSGCRRRNKPNFMAAEQPAETMLAGAILDQARELAVYRNAPIGRCSMGCHGRQEPGSRMRAGDFDFPQRTSCRPGGREFKSPRSDHLPP